MAQASLAKSARWLACAGALPFIGLCFHTWLWPEYRNFGARGLMAYAAVVISFLGAVYWGLALQREQAQFSAAQPGLLALSWGVAPALLAWCGLMLPPQLARYWMLGVLLLCLFVDLFAGRLWPLPRWYLQLRVVLTLVASAALLLARLLPGTD